MPAALLVLTAIAFWQRANSRPKVDPSDPDGTDPTPPAWWPTGFVDPAGLNIVAFDLETQTQSEAFNCETRSTTQRITASAGSGVNRFSVKEDSPSGMRGPCGNLQAPDSAFGYVNQFGDFISVSSTQTSERVVAINYSNAVVRPYDGAANAVPYPAYTPSGSSAPPMKLPSNWASSAAPGPSTAPPAVEPAVVPAGVPVPVPAQAPGGAPQYLPAQSPAAAIPKGQPVLSPKVTPAPAPVETAVTPPGQVIPWPGAPPIGQPSQAPRPSMAGIAQELGRIERKLEIMNTPTKADPPALDGLSMRDKLRLIWDLLQGFLDAGGYTLSSPCVPDGEPGSTTSPLVTSWGSSLTPFGGLENRVNALAQLLQFSKQLPQPTCRKPAISGEWVTVQFESDDVSPAGEKRLRKNFRYLDQNFGQLEDHVNHWAEFSWRAGPWCVIHKGGVWGVPQVWAASAEEGKRVIRHAAAIAGVNVDAAGSSWSTTLSTSGRFGQPGIMRVRRGTDRAWLISKRAGQNGLPEYLVPTLSGPAP